MTRGSLAISGARAEGWPVESGWARRGVKGGATEVLLAGGSVRFMILSVA